MSANLLLPNLPRTRKSLSSCCLRAIPHATISTQSTNYSRTNALHSNKYFHSWSMHLERRRTSWRRHQDEEKDTEEKDDDARDEDKEEDTEENEQTESNSAPSESRLKSSFKQLLEMRLKEKDISSYDTLEHSHRIAVGSLPNDISEYKTPEELLAIRDVLDLHMKHASKERALNMYFKYYRSSTGLQPSYKTYRYLFYKWRASPDTLRMLEPDFQALCDREPNDLNGIRSVLNVLLLCQRLFDYPIQLRKFFAASHGTDYESSAVWKHVKLLEWMPPDREVERVLSARATKDYIESNDGLVFKEGQGSEGLDWKLSVTKERAEHRQKPGGSIWEGGKPRDE